MTRAIQAMSVDAKRFSEHGFQKDKHSTGETLFFFSNEKQNEDRLKPL